MAFGRLESRLRHAEDIVCCVSGFMACLSRIYDLEYDGWGCVIRRGE